MKSYNDENVNSPKQPQLKDNHFSCSLKELQAMQLMLFCNQWQIQGRGLGGPSPPPPHPPLMFRPKWGPKGRPKLSFEAAPTPHLRVWMTGSPPPPPPPLSEGLDLTLVTPQYLAHFTHEQWPYNPPWEIGKMRDRPFPLQFNIINFYSPKFGWPLLTG